jgi:WD40 repeat protein
VQTLIGHEDEVLDICFSPNGTRIVTASADKTGKIYNVSTGELVATLKGSS